MWRSVAIYARVSTDGQTIEQQEAKLRGWVEGRASAVTVFAEKASSRKERPVQQDMLRRARVREFDAIVVWKFDRFARTARELLMWLHESQGLGIDFLSYTESLDSSTSMGKAMFTILAALAELERSLISERTKAKLDYLRAKGVKLGRPRVPVDMERAGRLVLEHGLSVRKLARALGVSTGTAAKIKRELLEASVQETGADSAEP